MNPMMPLIFGIGHRARQGKDVVASAIAKHFAKDYDIRVYSFAAELKREVNEAAEAAGGMRELFHLLPTPSWVKYDLTAPMDDPLCPLGKQRELLQWWGAEYRRAQNPDYWVERLAARLEEDKLEIAVISDMRFPNEMKLCKAYGETIKVVRPGYASPNLHISEEALAHVPDSEWSAVIVNDGTLEDLQRKAVEVFQELMESVPK
jgi:hypothetical protein